MVYRRKFIRRTGRRYGRTFARKTFRRRRYMRMFRKTGKPEVKWVNFFNSVVTNSGTANSQLLTPETMAQGTTQSTRIGNKIKFLSFQYHMEILADTIGTYTLPVSLVRVIIWTPKLTASSVQANMETLSNAQFVDSNIAHTYVDRSFNLYQINFTGTNTEPTASDMYTKRIKGFIRFPRTVDFIQGSTSVLDFKDQIYVTTIVTSTGGPQVINRIRTRTKFVDM